jgi:predicted amidohydrolase YtcJ
MILRNCDILTLDEPTPQIENMAIERECIIAVGAEEDIVNLAGPQTEIVNLEGRTVLPGLVDAHIHLEKYALNLDRVDCEVSSLEDCLKRVKKATENASPGEWILGHGWNQNDWERYGTASDLDLIAPNNPIYLTAKSLHAGWANTCALQRANVGSSTPDPHDGYIQRDTKGYPIGILFEGAMRLMSEALPTPTASDIAAIIPPAQEKLWRYGITGLHNFDGQRCSQALELLRARGDLGLRVVNNIQLDDLDNTINLGVGTGDGDLWIRTGNLKIYADGALGPRTAAMLAPYNHAPDNTGIIFYSKEELLEIFIRAVENNLAMAVHAIGDRANRDVLDAFEELRHYENKQNLPRRQHRIEHLQLLHPDDVPRPAILDIAVSMQPFHAISDMEMAMHYWGGRSRYAYAWRSQLHAGARMVFGSDAPVETPNPFWGLHAAVTRKHLDESPGTEGWIPNERIDLRDALIAYTQGPAHVAGLDMNLGKLAEGFLADVIVLEANPFKCSTRELADLLPVGTMVGGAWRYRTF